ncbi:MAG: beta-galactosidase trimerization domain-containing protein, partial [Planctomycetia bacterium]
MRDRCRSSRLRRTGPLVAVAVAAVGLLGADGPALGPRLLPGDVRDDHHAAVVTRLGEDAETLRLALGAAWESGLACRASAEYLAGWQGAAAAPRRATAEALLRDSTRMYELVKCIDDGVLSVRLARDSRAAIRLPEDIAFWRNEIALAATEVVAHAERAAACEQEFAAALRVEAAERGIDAVLVEPPPWPAADREAWRRAGPAVGVRVGVDTRPESLAAWWNDHLGLGPWYVAVKLGQGGARFITPEMAIGAWGHNAAAPGRYDWSGLDAIAAGCRDRGLGLLLELPTLQADRSPAEETEAVERVAESGWPVLDRHAPARPRDGIDRAAWSLVARRPDGTLAPQGGVQLLEPAAAAAYGRYLRDLADHLREAGLLDTIVAIHLERGDAAALPEDVDFSPLTRNRWQAFCREAYGTIAATNAAAGTTATAFEELEIPVRAGHPTAGGYAGGIDYLEFRRRWVRDYLAVKRRLVEEAFPGKLVIAEMRQAGDHDGIAGKPEAIWGGFASADHAQWTGTGPANDTRPFMIRSVQPVGFGSRVSDALESLYRDYLWIHFREAGNLTRYFYDWVAHGYLDFQYGWHSVTNWWLTNRILHRIGPTVAATAPEPQPIGLFFPRSTYDLAEGDSYYGFLGWDWMLQAAKLPCTRIDEDVVRDGGLAASGTKLLILPAARALDRETAAALAAWVEQGGTLLAEGVPGMTDRHGRPVADSPLTAVFGGRRTGTVSEPVADTPLSITLPHGAYSGTWAETTDRRPEFETYDPGPAEVLARYAGGAAAIIRHRHGAGTAVLMGYAFGREAVTADRTSIGFYRTYLHFVREPQLVARTAWLRGFVTDTLRQRPEFGVTRAEVARFTGVETVASSFSTPKGLSADATSPLFVRTFGDPRAGHELEVVAEAPDMALRFFPRHHPGLDTRYVGISTREVHYLGPRATVQMLLAPHVYRCRIEDPRIAALWDVDRDVPVGFDRDERGVAFTVSLPSGHVMLLAVSRSPRVQLVPRGDFPGRDAADVVAAARRL